MKHNTVRTVFYIDPQSMINLAKYDYYLTKNISMPIYYFCSKYYDYNANPKLTYKKVFSYNKKTHNWQKAISYIWSYFIIILYVIKIRPKIIHIQWFRIPHFDYCMVLLFQFLGSKVVYTAHNILPHQGNEKKNTNVFHKAYDTFDSIIVHTQATKDEIFQTFNVTPEKIVVINHGILPFNYDAKKYEENNGIFDKKYPLHGKIVFSALGYQNYYKGTDIIAKVWNETPELNQNKNCILMIIGKVNDNKIDLTELSKWDNVIIYNHRIPDDEFIYLVRHTDVYLLPYREISQSGALMTVMSEHIPVLVTNVGGLAEPLTIAPVGWIIHYPSPKELKRALLHLTNHTDIIKAVKEDHDSWDKVCQHYAWERIGNQTQQLYESL